MNKKTKNVKKLRMIHVRLDESTHKDLKFLVLQRDTTIQEFVERLVLQRIAKTRSKNVKKN